MSLIEVHNVSKSFGGLQALEGCSLSVEEGSIAGLIGPNGSGKTTLFNIITGYERLDAGTVLYRQETITDLPPEKIFRLGIGRTFQLTRIFPRLTVLENMHIAAQRKSGLRELLKSWTSTQEQRQALDLLDFVGLTALKEEQASSLSYGQKKLLEFALISAANPRVILLDEPASGINPTMIAYLGERIRDLNKRGVTFFIVEHNMEFVMDLCSVLTVLHRGGKIAEGPAEEVRKNPAVLEAYLGE